jgi:hypothetical protein
MELEPARRTPAVPQVWLSRRLELEAQLVRRFTAEPSLA